MLVLVNFIVCQNIIINITILLLVCLICRNSSVGFVLKLFLCCASDQIYANCIHINSLFISFINIIVDIITQDYRIYLFFCFSWKKYQIFIWSYSTIVSRFYCLCLLFILLVVIVDFIMFGVWVGAQGVKGAETESI